MFTEMPTAKVKTEVEGVADASYAKAGHKAKETVSFPMGEVKGPYGSKLEHTLEPTLRKNGMPTRLKKGMVELLAAHTLCEKGETLSPAQAALLRIFDYKFAQFEMKLVCRWHAEEGFEEYQGAEDPEKADESGEDDEEEELNPFEGY